jgi:hypothetical protein
MNKIVTLLFILISSFSFSQRDTISNFRSDGYVIEYSQKFFNNDFGGNLKSIKNIESNSLSVETISLTYVSDNIAVSGGISRFSYLSGYLRFSYVIPKKIFIDSVEQNLRGFNFTMPFYGKNLVKKKNLSLFYTFGVQVGRLKLVREENEQKQKTKNMTFAPYVGLVAKVNISKVCISFIAQYDYDISSKMWKNQWFHKGQDVHFNGIRQSGLTFSTGVGYAF